MAVLDYSGDQMAIWFGSAQCMRGPNGDCNGCVPFKDYCAFIDACKNKRIRKLAVGHQDRLGAGFAAPVGSFRQIDMGVV